MYEGIFAITVRVCGLFEVRDLHFKLKTKIDAVVNSNLLCSGSIFGNPHDVRW